MTAPIPPARFLAAAHHSSRVRRSASQYLTRNRLESPR